MGGAAQIITDVVAIGASIFAGPEVGAAILYDTGMAAAAAEAGVSAATVGAAAIGGSVGAVNAAINGKNLGGILQAGAEGALASGAGSAVSGAVAGEAPVTDEVTQTTTPGTGVSGATGSAELGKAAGQFAGGTTSGLLKGETPQQALTSGAIGAGVGYMLPGTDTASALERGLATTALNQFLAPSSPGAGGGGSATQTTPAGAVSSPAVTQTQASPGSAALGQALRTDLGAPVFGGTEDKQKNQSGWNVESLRYMGGGE
jgi:hypothetical protein